MGLLVWLELAPSEEDKKLKELVKNSYNSARVVGRGTIRIDPAEVTQSSEFIEAQKKAGEFMKLYRNKPLDL